MSTKQLQSRTAAAQWSHDVDVAVVGGGLAGLAGATLLARAGKKVVVLEKSAVIGGRAASLEHGGYIFNLGAHALYGKSPATEVLHELGVTYTNGTPSGIRYMSGDSNSLAPVDPSTLLRTDMLSPAAKWEAGRLLLKLQLADPDSHANITLSDWLDREVSRIEVRHLLETSARVVTYTNAPQQLSVGVFIEQLRQATKGKVIYVDGGWQMLVNSLETAARKRGVQIVAGARVEAVEHDAGYVTGVRLADGTTYKAQAVVMALGPREAARMVAEGENPALQDWAESAIPVKGACLDVALRRLPNRLNRVVMCADRPLFLTVQSEFAKIAPNGGVLLHALMYLDPSAPQDAEANEQALEGWLDQTQQGWRDEVVERRYLPNLVVSNALVAASQGGLKGRPGPEVPGIHNLYVVGDWVGPKGILASASLWSAKLAAQSILTSNVKGALPVAA